MKRISQREWDGENSNVTILPLKGERRGGLFLPPKAVEYICYELGIHEDDFFAA